MGKQKPERKRKSKKEKKAELEQIYRKNFPNKQYI
jgi:hypothetical protein